jgi:hypothetical protein
MEHAVAVNVVAERETACNAAEAAGDDAVVGLEVVEDDLDTEALGGRVEDLWG